MWLWSGSAAASRVHRGTKGFLPGLGREEGNLCSHTVASEGVPCHHTLLSAVGWPPEGAVAAPGGQAAPAGLHK